MYFQQSLLYHLYSQLAVLQFVVERKESRSRNREKFKRTRNENGLMPISTQTSSFELKTLFESEEERCETCNRSKSSDVMCSSRHTASKLETCLSTTQFIGNFNVKILEVHKTNRQWPVLPPVSRAVLRTVFPMLLNKLCAVEQARKISGNQFAATYTDQMKKYSLPG